MCGICGIVHADNNQGCNKEELIAMRDVITHRGPDDEGIYYDGHAGLGHRRLSIVDLSGGHQPLTNEDSTIWIVFNGEIYNYKKLQELLISKGHRFRTNCDTEVLVHLYEEYGLEMLSRLQGMFALAIWDTVQERLFIARDRLGIKPLYYCISNQTLYFASEIKALLHCKAIKTDLNRDALFEYFIFRFTAGERTLYQGIKSLLPGYYLIWQDGSLKTGQYWSQSFMPARFTSLSKAQAFAKLDDMLHRAVEKRLMSDVPLGTMNSGGVDSSLVTAYAAEQINQPVNTYSVGFSESDYDESSYAEIVSQKFGTNHHTLTCTPKDFAENLPLAIWYNDEPLNHANSVPIYLICKLAKQKVTVLLTGEGADEIFAGYPRYWLLKLHSMLSTSSRKLLQPSLRCLPGHYANKLSTFLTFSPQEALLYNSSFVHPTDVGRVFKKELLTESFAYRNSLINGFDSNAPAAQQALHLDIQTYLVSILHRMDKMSMAARVEARVPFLDHELVEFALSLPISWKLDFFAGKTKANLKKLALKRLPREIVFRKKSGFGLPLGEWFRDNNSLGPYLNILTEDLFFERSVVNPDIVTSMVQKHRSGEKDYADILWELVNFELWCRMYIDRLLSEETVKEYNHNLQDAVRDRK